MKGRFKWACTLSSAALLCFVVVLGGDNPTEAQQAQIQVNTFARWLLNPNDKCTSGQTSFCRQNFSMIIIERLGVAVSRKALMLASVSSLANHLVNSYEVGASCSLTS